MALRVLLADESSTIKKVMQLALSDFAVEVKAVPVGLDVLSVAKTFKPDIVFADVLLTKRSGYEVCADLKQDAETAHIPVVLIWSGFMEIDEVKATECKADRRLEKPFDAEHLRSIVNDLVAKTKSNPVSSFMTFPEMPDFEESTTKTPQAIAEEIYAVPEVKEDEFLTLREEGEDFAAVPLTEPKMNEEQDEGGWAHQDLSKFKIQVPETEAQDFATKFVIPQDDEFSQAHVEIEGDFEEISFGKPEQKAPAKSPSSNAQPNTQSKMDLNSNMMEKIVREEAREMIEAICWKIIPEIAERIVREEINKILKEI